MTNLSTLTNAQLTTTYNELATSLGLKTIAPWKGKKPDLIAKIEKLEAQVRETPPKDEAPKKSRKVRERKTPVNKVDALFVDAVVKVITEGGTPSAAFRAALEQFPKTTRIIAKHSAMAAGLNALTARNLFDRIKKAQ